MDNIPIILHIPHSSKIVPDEVRKTFLLSDAELEEELLKMTDAYTDELFTKNINRGHIEIYPVSRLVVDPERFIDDDKELMAKCGMGVIYSLTSDRKKLREPISDKERDRLISMYYHPYRDKMNSISREQIKKYGKSLVIDCHSFPSLPLPYELDQSVDRPDICIGRDDFHTPGWLSRNVIKLFKDFGYSVEMNKPFEGCFVPSEFYHLDKRALSLMIEINRKLYMNEGDGGKNKRFETLQDQLTYILKKIAKMMEGNL